MIARRFTRAAAASRPARLPPVLAVQERQRPFIDEMREKLTGGGYAMRNFACPCGSDSEDVVISEVDRYGLPVTFVLCMSCGTIRIDPYLEEESLTDFYVHTYQQMYRRNANLDKDWGRQRAYGRAVLDWVESSLPPGGWVYEAGCGAGGGLMAFHEAGYQVAGSDYSEELVEYGRGRGVPNLHVGSTEDLIDQGLPRADVLYLHHVLEHVNDPVEALAECGGALAEDGRIVVIVPDVSRIGDFPYPGGDLLPFLHIAHKFNFSVEGLRRTAARAGFREVRMKRSSEAAEMWMELVRADGDARARDGADQAGRAMLGRLKRTERLHRLGLSPGQLRRRRDRAKAWAADTRAGQAIIRLRSGKEAQ